MKGEILYKGYIREFDRNVNQTAKEEIIYRIININDIFFFAEEISIGCIFPVYNYTSTKEENYTRGNIFNSFTFTSKSLRIVSSEILYSLFSNLSLTSFKVFTSI